MITDPATKDNLFMNVFATVNPGAINQSKIAITPRAVNNPLNIGLYSV